MAKNIAFAAVKREKAGKGVSRALRRENRIPAVIYGDGKDPVRISLSANDVNVAYLKGHMFTTLTDLDVEGEKHLVLARDIQLDPVKDFVLHVDFLRVSPKTKIHVKVPVHFINHDSCPALDKKATLNIVRHEVELVCQAMNIPESIESDLSGIEVGTTIRISHIPLPAGSTPAITDRDFTIATLVPPRRVEKDDETEAGSAVSAEAAA